MPELADPLRAARVLDLVGEAFDLAPAERPAFLQSACGEDAALLAEVASLLTYQSGSDTFLVHPAFQIDPETLAPPSGELPPGTILGDCRIESLLGEGGMGEVYLAQDTVLGRKVAVKLLKRHLDDSDLLRRFRHERRILAGLTHPGIARLYGAAVSPEGRSYLVMEYVEGERLDHYCDHHGLGIPERLALFRQVCAAVAYAHGNLVIHRDLKPANLRVTPGGEPKLLDFGVAKLLDSGQTTAAPDVRTLTLAAAMTPEYASPEQLRGESITVASDVYSLGVVLYELLTGERPYHFKNRRPDEVARVICEEEIRRPSTVVGRAAGAARHPAFARRQRQLAGDLDNIVAMALRKEPARRYASVAQFAEDIRRHEAGLPVLARKDTTGYRVSRFVRRHRKWVAAAALILLALVAGLITTAWEARRADRRFEDVRRLAHSILFEVEPQIASLTGATAARSTLVKRALEYLDSLSQEAGGNRELRGELATAYEKVGDVQGNPGQSNLGDLKGALASYRKARELWLSMLASAPHDAMLRHHLATNEEQLGVLLWWDNRTDDALAMDRDALTIRRALLAAQPGSVEFRQGLASLLVNLADVYAWNGQTTGALKDYGEALPILQAFAADRPTDAARQISLARCLSRLGIARRDVPDVPGALDAFHRAQDLLAAVIQRDPNNQSARAGAWYASYQECVVYEEKEELAQALPLAARTVAMAEEMVRADPKDSSIAHDLAISDQAYGEALSQAKRWPEAIDYLRRGMAIDTRLGEQSPENGEYAHSCATDYESIGEAHWHLGQLAEAAADEQSAQTLMETAASKDPGNVIPRRELVGVLTLRGQISEGLNQPTEARRDYERALSILEALVAGKSTTKNDARESATLRARLQSLPPPVFPKP